MGRRDLCLTDRVPPLKEIAPGHWAQDCPGCLSHHQQQEEPAA
jgi:hypothetical protein